MVIQHSPSTTIRAKLNATITTSGKTPTNVLGIRDLVACPKQASDRVEVEKRRADVPPPVLPSNGESDLGGHGPPEALRVPVVYRGERERVDRFQIDVSRSGLVVTTEPWDEPGDSEATAEENCRTVRIEFVNRNRRQHENGEGREQ